MRSTSFISNATEFFGQIDTRTTFITIHNYINNFDELATHSVLWHVDYEAVVKKSLTLLQSYSPCIQDCIGRSFTLTHLRKAHQELLDSFEETLLVGAGNNSRYTHKETYDLILDSHRCQVPGVKLHHREDAVHLTALFRIKKVVHFKGQYPYVDHEPLTLAKAFLRSQTPLVRWGQYKLVPGRFEKITVCKRTVREEDVVRSLPADEIC